MPLQAAVRIYPSRAKSLERWTALGRLVLSPPTLRGRRRREISVVALAGARAVRKWAPWAGKRLSGARPTLAQMCYLCRRVCARPVRAEISSWFQGLRWIRLHSRREWPNLTFVCLEEIQ